MRHTIFDNLVNDEDDFTELLCNMVKFEEFENILYDFFGIKNKEKYIETQYQTEKNGIPDLVISYDDGIEFIEVKVGDRRLTKNQPEGYIRELSNRTEKNKKLYFLIPKNYYYLKELKSRIKNLKGSNIKIEIKYWEDFFEYSKKNEIFLKNKVIFEYYNLLKSWFGYETITFNKGDKNIMNENGKIMTNVAKFLDSIWSQLEQNGYRLVCAEGFDAIGIEIYNKYKKDVYYGWIGIIFSLWSNTGDCFIYNISDRDNKKYFNNFINKYKDCKTYDKRENDSPDGKWIHKYICFDDDIFNKKNNEGLIFIKILDILKNIKSSK
jgi:hypothetical protein